LRLLLHELFPCLPKFLLATDESTPPNCCISSLLSSTPHFNFSLLLVEGVIGPLFKRSKNRAFFKEESVWGERPDSSDICASSGREFTRDFSFPPPPPPLGERDLQIVNHASRTLMRRFLYRTPPFLSPTDSYPFSRRNSVFFLRVTSIFFSAFKLPRAKTSQVRVSPNCPFFREEIPPPSLPLAQKIVFLQWHLPENLALARTGVSMTRALKSSS